MISRISVIALSVLGACSSTSEPSHFDFADLPGSTWQGTQLVEINDSTGVLTCSISWTATFDTLIFASPDTLDFLLSDHITATCPGQPDRPWPLQGLPLFAVTASDSVYLRPLSNPAIAFARLGPIGGNRLRGPVDDLYLPAGALTLTPVAPQ